MYLFIGLLLASMALKTQQFKLSDCGDTLRRPEYTDISVECGTTSISLFILLCPVVFTGYNESALVLNEVSNDPQCEGTYDASASPPVVRFDFPLNESNACGSVFVTTDTTGTGVFSEFSSVQTVNVSGAVRSHDPTTGTVTYNTELKYYFSCSYPLEYLINNTRLDVATSSIAVKDNNGSFISTLSMALYSDMNYTSLLIIPQQGIELRTVIYVQVKATNLTDQYHVLLDRCYASTSPYPGNTTYFNLFIPCFKAEFTTMLENGDSQNARFSFEAFRFIEQQNQTVSTYYLHCITRLCESSTCSGFFKGCNRRKRDVSSSIADGVTEPTTLSTPLPIVAKIENVLASKDEDFSSGRYDSTMGLGIAVGVLAAAVVVVLGFALLVYKRVKPFAFATKNQDGRY